MTVNSDGQSVAGNQSVARQLNRLRRQVALGCALAALFIVRHYAPIEEFDAAMTWAEKIVSGTLLFDVLLRPLLRRVIPTRIHVYFGRDGSDE